MGTELSDGRRKLSPEDVADIVRRYWGRRETFETVQKIAEDFGIDRGWVRRLAKPSKKKKKAPVNAPDRAGG